MGLQYWYFVFCVVIVDPHNELQVAAVLGLQYLFHIAVAIEALQSGMAAGFQYVIQSTVDAGALCYRIRIVGSLYLSQIDVGVESLCMIQTAGHVPVVPQEIAVAFEWPYT